MTTPRHATKVIAAYDFSPSADQALRTAVDLAARDPQHVLHIAAVLDPHDRVTIGGQQEHATYDAADKVHKLIVDRVSAAFAGRTTQADVRVFVHVRIGKAALEILGLAAEIGADLIIIGSHGKTGVERLLLGSVSERVVREAKCPVMVARLKTYGEVDLLNVAAYEHARAPHREPHTYSYKNQQIVMQPYEWPGG